MKSYEVGCMFYEDPRRWMHCITHENLLKQPNKTDVCHKNIEVYLKKTEVCHKKTELCCIAIWKPGSGGGMQ